NGSKGLCSEPVESPRPQPPPPPPPPPDRRYDPANYSLRLRQLSSNTSGGPTAAPAGIPNGKRQPPPPPPPPPQQQQQQQQQQHRVITPSNFHAPPPAAVLAAMAEETLMAAAAAAAAAASNNDGKRRHSNGSFEGDKPVPPDVSLINSRHYGSTSSLEALQKTMSKVRISDDVSIEPNRQPPQHLRNSQQQKQQQQHQQHSKLGSQQQHQQQQLLSPSRPEQAKAGSFSLFKSFRKNNSLSELETPASQARARQLLAHWDCQSAAWRAEDLLAAAAVASSSAAAAAAATAAVDGSGDYSAGFGGGGGSTSSGAASPLQPQQQPHPGGKQSPQLPPPPPAQPQPPKRRNTGASAAAVAQASEDGGDETSGGCGRSSDDSSAVGGSNGGACGLLLRCPHFVNELGGEPVRVCAHTRLTCSRVYAASAVPPPQQPLLPPSANSACLLAQPLPGHCPEFADLGACYYRQHFRTFDDHTNWFGQDPDLGPLAVSLRREKISSQDGQYSGHLWRVIIRSGELRALRGCILEEAVPTHSRYSANKGLPPRDVLHFVAPQLPLSCLHLGRSEPRVWDDLVAIDEQVLINKIKVGVLLCKAGQSTEEEMYNNEHTSPALEEFMELIATKVSLKNFDKFKGGLDSKCTGDYTYYTTMGDCELVFHVSTMLPYSNTNRQQLLRKKHIGNDIVTIVFQEPGALAFSPRTIRSQFQHVFIVVRAHNPCTKKLYYSVAVSRSEEMPAFGPPFSAGHQFAREPAFREFLLRKIINGENAAFRSEKFCQMQKRTREDRLKELAESHSAAATIDIKSTRSLLGSGRRRSSKSLTASNDAVNRLVVELNEALRFEVTLTEPNNREMRCDLLIGRTYLALQYGQQVLLSIPTGCMLSWRTGQAGELTVYYNRGELLRMRCSTETACQLAARRLAWLGEQETPGACQAIEVTVHRVTAYEASLSFGVQADAFYVRSVDSAALPDVAKNSRLVELCGVPICAMPEARVFNLLQTEAQLALVLVPPTSKGAVRCSQELRDIFLTNRAHALFCPAGAAGSGQGSPEVGPDHGDCRFLDASLLRSGEAAVSGGSPIRAPPTQQQPHQAANTQEKLKRLINNEISEDQLRREDDWSQLVRSANQFAAAAANSTTSSSSGRGTAQKQQPRCGRCQQLEEQLRASEAERQALKRRLVESADEIERLRAQTMEAKQGLIQFTEKFFTSMDTQTTL
ncbi:hypothetical protein BOX15_Mlig023131g1, partial [Macrostomum lignano]